MSPAGSHILIVGGTKGTAAGRWLVTAGLVDSPTGHHITRNLWAQSKPGWYCLPEVRA
jgi:hypothetical protein